MNSDVRPDRSGFLPGDQVRVIDGTFNGMQGDVISRAEAQALGKQGRGEPPPLFPVFGEVYVMLNLFNRAVPVRLLHYQLTKV